MSTAKIRSDGKATHLADGRAAYCPDIICGNSCGFPSPSAIVYGSSPSPLALALASQYQYPCVPVSGGGSHAITSYSVLSHEPDFPFGIDPIISGIPGTCTFGTPVRTLAFPREACSYIPPACKCTPGSKNITFRARLVQLQMSGGTGVLSVIVFAQFRTVELVEYTGTTCPGYSGYDHFLWRYHTPITEQGIPAAFGTALPDGSPSAYQVPLTAGDRINQLKWPFNVQMRIPKAGDLGFTCPTFAPWDCRPASDVTLVPFHGVVGWPQRAILKPVDLKFLPPYDAVPPASSYPLYQSDGGIQAFSEGLLFRYGITLGGGNTSFCAWTETYNPSPLDPSKYLTVVASVQVISATTLWAAAIAHEARPRIPQSNPGAVTPLWKGSGVCPSQQNGGCFNPNLQPIDLIPLSGFTGKATIETPLFGIT